jgi:alpha-tubulin suppressor-like RCC1 family protein
MRPSVIRHERAKGRAWRGFARALWLFSALTLPMCSRSELQEGELTASDGAHSGAGGQSPATGGVVTAGGVAVSAGGATSGGRGASAGASGRLGVGGSITFGGSVALGGALSGAGRAGSGGAAGGFGGQSTGARSGSAGLGGVGAAAASAGAANAGFTGGGVAGFDAGAGAGGDAGASGAGPSVAPAAVGLALGAFHTCVYLADGALRCWGTEGYIGLGRVGTIGDDEAPATTLPVDIGGKVSAAAAGWYHTCVILESRNVRCFGPGLYGLLGYGNINSIGLSEAPATAGDVHVGGPVVQLAAGTMHTCAALEDGTVRCWGRNEDGQLGYPNLDSIGDDELPDAAGPVNVGGFVVQLAGGLGHTCALLDNGSVRCWGRGGSGRLGYGNENAIGDDETPAEAGDVDIGGKVTSIAAGAMHTCALLEGGTVRCWGVGFFGALGYGNLQNVGDGEVPADAGDVNVGGRVVEISAGDFATCARLESGAVRCWGAGDQGELGYGNTLAIGDDESPAAAGDVPVGAPVTHVDVGYLHVCVTLETGAVRCWGRGSTAALGYGNENSIGDDETPAYAGDVDFE